MYCHPIARLGELTDRTVSKSYGWVEGADVEISDRESKHS